MLPKNAKDKEYILKESMKSTGFHTRVHLLKFYPLHVRDILTQTR
jgi:hypothetical protein